MQKYQNAFIVAMLLITAQPASAQISGTASTSGKDANMNSGSSLPTSSDWNSQNSYWRDHYPSRPYYNSSRQYSTYEPAYRYGVDLYNQNPGKSYDQLDQSQLSSGWNTVRSISNLDWSDAQMATRDAYNRMYENQNSSSPANR